MIGWMSIPDATWDAKADPREISSKDHRRFIRRLRACSRLYRSVDPLGGYVHRIAQSVVVKCDVRVTEALTMDYIARHTTIPVPRVHDVFTWAGRTYIVMDYIKGSTH